MNRIVIVDDVEDNRDFLFYALNERFEVIGYSNGEDALSRLHTDRPSVVILDLSLPDINGFEVLRRIREQPEFESMPVIALTAHAMAGDREKCMAAGFTDYISKPILDLDEFTNCIEAYCAQSHK